MNNKKYVVYEYKKVTVKRDSVPFYIDCLENFGWTLIEEQRQAYGLPHMNPDTIASELSGMASQSSMKNSADEELITLKFKRDRKVTNRLEINKLERQYEEALDAIEKLEKKNSAQSIGISIGAGIIGTFFLGLAAYNFLAASMIVGTGCAVLGAAGWGVGFFAHRSLSKKKAEQSESKIQEHLETAYNACEQAHGLLI